MAAHTEEESWGQRNSICKDLEAEKISYYEIFCVTGVIIPCRARRACRTNSVPGRPECPSETITVILGVDQKYNIQTLYLGLESREPYPSFPPFFLLCSSSFSLTSHATSEGSGSIHLLPKMAALRTLCTPLV